MNLQLSTPLKMSTPACTSFSARPLPDAILLQERQVARCKKPFHTSHSTVEGIVVWVFASQRLFDRSLLSTAVNCRTANDLTPPALTVSM